MRALALTSLALLVATPAFAQQWTAEQQEVIDVIEACWDAWAAEDLSAINATCNEHPEAVFWLTNEATPRREWPERHRDDYLAGVYWPRTDVIYNEIQPLNVLVLDDVALVHFWALIVEEDTDGERRTIRQKRFDVYTRIGGQWSWSGNMISPES